MAMINSKINKVTAEGDNIFVFQYIDSTGNKTEERKSFEEFLQPFTKDLNIQIELLNNRLSDQLKTVADKEKITQFLDEKVLILTEKIQKLEQEKEQLTIQIEHFLSEVKGKELTETTQLYREAFDLFIKGKVDDALETLDDAKLEEEERVLLEGLKQKAETRILKAQMLRIKHKYDEAGKNYEKAVKLHDCWEISMETANFFAYLNEFDMAIEYFMLCKEKMQTSYQKISTLSNLGAIHIETKQYQYAENFFAEALEVYDNEKLDNTEESMMIITAIYNNLGNLHSAKNQNNISIDLFSKALKIYETLIQINPHIYLPQKAYTLNNLAISHRIIEQYSKAEQLFIKALDIYENLSNEYESLHGLANTANNLGVLYGFRKQYEKEELFLLKALQAYEILVKINPHKYFPLLARTENNLTSVLYNTNELNKAVIHSNNALAVQRNLVESGLKMYLTELQGTLNNAANLKEKLEDYNGAEKDYLEAYSILKELASHNPQVYSIDLARTSINISKFYQEHKTNKDLSMHFLEEALINISFFNHIPVTEDYLKRICYILIKWEVDFEKYMKDFKTRNKHRFL